MPETTENTTKLKLKNKIMNTEKSELKAKGNGVLADVLRSILQLPERIQGKGSRADYYNAWTTDVKIAVLNDAEFNSVIEHNTKRMNGEEANAISISNEGEDTYLIIRESALLQNIS